jgi:hypothetical protein
VPLVLIDAGGALRGTVVGMGAVVGIVAALVALLGLAVALGNVGYLVMLNNAATKRGAAGAPINDYVRSRRPVAAGAAGAAALGLLVTAGSSVPLDVLGMLLAAGGGVVAKNALDGTRARFRSQP